MIALLAVLTMTVSAQAAVPSKLVIVDLKAQMLYAYQDLDKVMELKVSTGRPGLDTPTGVVTVQRKDRTGTSINGEKLEYLIRIYMWDPKMKMRRRINIHEYKSVPEKAASSGCVRAKIGQGRKLYDWIDVGTPVHFLDDTAPGCLL